VLCGVGESGYYRVNQYVTDRRCLQQAQHTGILPGSGPAQRSEIYSHKAL
jgi:hypothetical protein